MIQALGPAIEQNLELEFWGHASDGQIGLCDIKGIKPGVKVLIFLKN